MNPKKGMNIQTNLKFEIYVFIFPNLWLLVLSPKNVFEKS